MSAPLLFFMPAIDLSRLRKQASRLADFFFVPDEFIRHLREMLDFYVDHTMRKTTGGYAIRQYAFVSYFSSHLKTN